MGDDHRRIGDDRERVGARAASGRRDDDLQRDRRARRREADRRSGGRAVDRSVGDRPLIAADRAAAARRHTRGDGCCRRSALGQHRRR